MDPNFFINKQEFYQFLEVNHNEHPGIWIKFDKRDIKNKLKPEEALDIALCLGWIDGLIKKMMMITTSSILIKDWIQVYGQPKIRNLWKD